MPIPQEVCFGLKVAASAYLFVLVRAILPRYRYDKLLELGWKVFLPLTMGFVALLLGILVAFDGLPFAAEVSMEPGLLLQRCI